jgi:hypothetical protein
MVVIYKMKTRRHYGMLPDIPEMDTPWSLKKNSVIFRGALTGSLRAIDYATKLRELDVRFRNDPEIIAETKCLMLDRCRLVYRNANSSFIDAKLIERRVQNEVPSIIHGIEMFGSYMSKRELLKHKAIIMLEGNGR